MATTKQTSGVPRKQMRTTPEQRAHIHDAKAHRKRMVIRKRGFDIPETPPRFEMFDTVDVPGEGGRCLVVSDRDGRVTLATPHGKTRRIGRSTLHDIVMLAETCPQRGKRAKL